MKVIGDIEGDDAIGYVDVFKDNESKSENSEVYEPEEKTEVDNIIEENADLTVVAGDVCAGGDS